MSAAEVSRIETLRREVDAHEFELRVAVRDLERAAREAVDLRRQIASHPWLWTGASLALGVWLGGRR